MKTKYLDNSIDGAAELILSGGVVAVPTETVYGLAANGLDPSAVEKVFEAKGRAESKAVSLFVSGMDDVERLCEDIPPAAYVLADRFWPGPLTMVLKKRDIVPGTTSGGGDTIGVRCPDSPLALELLRRCGVPLTGTSANVSGMPDAVTADAVREYFDGRIDCVVDGGRCPGGVPSTVVLLTGKRPKILRRGGIPSGEIYAALGEDMKIIGITGPTGSGKTTALRVLEKLGGEIVDCDRLYHRLLEENTDMVRGIGETFPGTVSMEQGRPVLDRKALGAVVFNDPEKLEKLNALTHGFVREAVSDIIADARDRGVSAVGIDAIALIESGLGDLCGVTVAVVAPAEMRAERIMAREGISRQYAMSRIAAQKDDAFFRENCDHTLENNGTQAEFQIKCETFFNNLLGRQIMADEKNSERREKLFFNKKNGWDVIPDDERKAVYSYAEGYMAWLNAVRTEREAVNHSISMAEDYGFVEYRRGMDLKPGTKIYFNNRGKALMLAVIGEKPMSEGCVIAAAHTDAPRIDLKQNPLYEDTEMAFFKTHYYGGIKKYQWTVIPLELHGVVALKDGTNVEIVIGRDRTDPKFVITDLLPHLAADQMKKTLAEGITGEGLNLLIGSIPDSEEGKDRVSLAVLDILNRRYGITEEDFLSAELEAVPAFDVCDIGLDRSLIGGYGHDDRVCSYAELKAICDIPTPPRTSVCIFADKEEIGSVGVSGMQSRAFEWFIGELCGAQGTTVSECFSKSFCLSADVCNAFDPNFPEVSEKKNDAKVNYGVGICKFTGSRGKSGSSDASAEIVGRLRRVFAENGVEWQMAELGKVDQGGGGTVAMFMANRNIDTIDAGVPVLSMHAPFETVSKFDCYMTYKAVKSLYMAD